jgi:hypothetical protein
VGWWFLFIWLYFNKIESQGLLRGSLAALVASTNDPSLLNLSSNQFGPPTHLPWMEWGITLFQTFWGGFSGGGSINFPDWNYGVLLLFSVAALWGLALAWWERHKPARFGKSHQFSTPAGPALGPLYLMPLFFLPLPLLRFILTGGNVAETAQGRHLFPALPLITVGLVWGLFYVADYLSANLRRVKQSVHLLLNPALLLPIYLFILSLYGLALIHPGYPPPIPLYPTAEAVPVKNRLDIKMGDGIYLAGYELGNFSEGVLPVTLLWRAEAIPSQDYLIKLTLQPAQEPPLGQWLGHPVGGRYPSRAWDPGDILRDTIPLPLLPGLPPTTNAILSLQLLDPRLEPITEPLTLGPPISLPATPLTLHLPPQLRADGLAPADPLTYRSTVSFVLPGQTPSPLLLTPAESLLSPILFLPGEQGSLAHFIVGADWPSGLYHLQNQETPLTVQISNRPRRFEPPPLDYTVEANFAEAITLLGYDLPQRRVEPGQSFPITLHWRAEQPLSQDLTVFNP